MVEAHEGSELDSMTQPTTDILSPTSESGHHRSTNGEGALLEQEGEAPQVAVGTSEEGALTR
eukprot:4356775-Alexandrium_andersonii.AAC.1